MSFFFLFLYSRTNGKMKVCFDTLEATDDELHTCISHHGGIPTSYVYSIVNSRYLTK